MTAPVAPRVNPYVGPRSFRVGERMYGRDREIETLYSLLIAERIVLMYSPSGAGKSSLLQAGLIPRLQAERFVVRPPIRVGTDPPRGSPPGVNRFMLSALLSVGDDTDDDSPESLAALVRVPLARHLGERRARERAREQALAREREAAGDDDEDDDAPGMTRGEVLIFDQFEEILTVEPSELAAKQAFFRELGEALRDDGRWAVFAMREDFIAGLDPFRSLVPHRLRATFRLDLLRTDAAVTAIQSPARAAGVDLTDEAARQLAEDLAQIKVQRVDGSVDVRSGPYVEPVQLQVVCHRMWERLPADARAIGLPEVRALGAVDDALALYFDAQVAAAAAACEVPERSLRAWLGRHLVTPQGMRTQVLQTPEATLELANAVLWRLVDGHTLRSDSRRGMIWFELAHDRLVKPMQRSNERWARVHTTAIQQQAALWHAQGRPERLLLPGSSDFDQVARDVGECTPTEREFLEQSRASAARHRKLRRSQRLIVALGAAVLVLVVVALVVGFVVYDKYQTKKHALAEARGALAEQAAGDHEREARGSLTRQLGAQAQLYTKQRPEVAALLGVAAAHFADGWPRTGALLATVAGAPQRVGQFTLPAGVRALVRDGQGGIVVLDGRGGLHLREVDGVSVRTLATSFGGDEAAGPAETEGAGRGPTGTTAMGRTSMAVAAHPGRAELVLGDATGRLTVWDIAADREVRALAGVIEPGRDGLQLAIDATGTRLAALTWTLDGENVGDLAVVELASGEVVSRRRLARVSPGALALAPDGRLAATSEPDAVVLHRVDGGAAQRVPLAARATRLRFSADNAQLHALDGIGGAWVWTIADGALLGPPRPARVGESILDVVFAPDGQLAALTGPPGRRALSLWRGGSARPEGVPIAVGDDVRSVQFVGPDSGQLAAISPEGDVTLYDPALDRPTRVGGPDGGVVVMASHEDATGTTTVAAASYESAAQSGALHIWRLTADALQLVDALPGITAPPRQLFFDPSGRELTVLTDAHAQTWDLTNRTSASEPLPGSGERLLVGAHHGGVRVATVVDGEVVVADASDGWRPRPIVESHGATQIALAGEVLAIARCTDRTFTDLCVTSELRVVDAASGRVLRVEADPHAARVVALALSQNGERLASAAADGSLIHLKISAGPRHSLSTRRPLHFTEGLAFSADGKIVAEVSAAPDAGLGAASEIQLWDLEGGDILAPAWRGHDPRVRSEVAARRSLLFTGTDHLLSSSHDGITVWNFKNETLRRRACMSAGRELTYEEWLRFVGAERGYREVCVGVLGGYPLRGQALGFIPPRFGQFLVTRTPVAALPYFATFPPFAE